MSIPKRSKGTGKIYLGDKIICNTPCGYQPTSATIAYYPLNSTTTIYDMKGGTGTKYNLTNGNNTPFQTYYGKDCAVFTTANHNYFECSSLNAQMIGNNFTVSVWYNSSHQRNHSTRECQFKIVNTLKQSSYRGWDFGMRDNQSTYSCMFEVCNGSGHSAESHLRPSINTWHNLIATYDGNNIVLTIDGSDTYTGTGGLTLATDCILEIGVCKWSSSTIDSRYNGGMCEIIIESGIRDSTKKLKYYNENKSDFGR